MSTVIITVLEHQKQQMSKQLLLERLKMHHLLAQKDQQEEPLNKHALTADLQGRNLCHKP
jgi:hypothetical protein